MRSRSAARNRESGQATAEYALLLALVAAGLLVALLLFRASIDGPLGRVANRVDGPDGGQETGAMPAGTGVGGAGPAAGAAGPAAGGGLVNPGGSGGKPDCGGGGCGGGKDH